MIQVSDFYYNNSTHMWKRRKYAGNAMNSFSNFYVPNQGELDEASYDFQDVFPIFERVVSYDQRKHFHYSSYSAFSISALL